MRSTETTLRALALATVAAGGLAGCGVAGDSVPGFKSESPTTPVTGLRPEDPVVVTGADVASLRGAAIRTIVGFRYAQGPRYGNASSTDGEPPTAHPSSWTRTIYYKAPFEASGPAAAALVDNPLQVTVEYF